MSVVCVDVGCAIHPGEDSIARLIERFQPERLYGFDPLTDGQPARIGMTKITLMPVAAWTSTGTIGFRRDGSRSHIGTDSGDHVACVDLAAFIRGLEAAEIILKLDAEGAEYTLLPHLHDQGVDRLLRLVWVEWHPQRDPDGTIEQRIRAELACPIEDWHY